MRQSRCAWLVGVVFLLCISNPSPSYCLCQIGLPMIMSREEILQLISDVSIKKEIHRFEETWPRFKTAFDRKEPSCRDFVVVVVQVLDGKLKPFGIQVEKIEGDEIIGRCFENQLRRKIDQVVKVSKSQVIDFRYARSYLLEEGGLYRFLEMRLSAPSRRYIDECANFFLDVPNECSIQDFELLRRVEESRSNQELLKICVSPGCDPVRKRKLPGYNREKKISNFSILEYLATHGFEDKTIGLISSYSLDKSTMEDLFRISIEWKCNTVFFHLLNHGSELRHTKWGLENCLHVAVKSNNLEVAKCLVELGLDLEEPNVLGETPFAIVRSKEMAMMLQSKGADVYRQIADDGTTAAEYLYVESYAARPEVASFAATFCSQAFLDFFHAGQVNFDEDEKFSNEPGVVPLKGTMLDFVLEAAETDFGAALPVRELK